MSAILFFSNNCPHSVKFIEILKKAGEVDSISKFICVDKVRKSRPIEVSKYGIVEVPTVLVGNKKKAGAEAFHWLSETVAREAPQMQREKAVRQSHQKAISGIQSGSMFDQYEAVVNLNIDNSIYGDSPVPPEGKIEKEDFFVMQNDNLAGSSKFYEEEDKVDGASQFDKEYKRLLEERNNL